MRLPPKYLTGYHFTTSSAWKKIRKHGLVPYAMPKLAEELRIIGKKKGIWLWQRQHKEDALVGAVMLRVIAHHKTSIVLLRATFPETHELINIIWKRRNERWSITHKGSLSDDDNPDDPWIFHSAEPSFIVVNRIPPENIKRLATFNLRSILNKLVA